MSEPFFNRTARFLLNLVAWGSLVTAIAFPFAASAPPIQSRLSPVVCKEGQHLVTTEVASTGAQDPGGFNMHCADEQGELHGAWWLAPIWVGTFLLSFFVFFIVGRLKRLLR